MSFAAGLLLGAVASPESPAQVASAHPVPVKNLNRGAVTTGPLAPQRLGDFFVVAAFTPGSGLEWWRIDPNRKLGASRIRDIAPGSASALDFNRFAALERSGVLYFAADDRVHGRELWRTDGTETGTRLVKDLAEGPAHSDPDSLVALNGKILGSGIQGDGFNQGVWSSDGTPEGTFWLRPSPSPNGGISRLVVSGGAVWFTENQSPGSGLWKTDGTVAGTVRVAALGSESIKPWSLTAADGHLYFFGNGASDPSSGNLWVSDTTASGTLQVRQGIPGASGDPQTVFGAGSRFFFQAGTAGSRLWRTDGTPAGTQAVGPQILGEAVLAGGSHYLTGIASDRTELWRLDPASGDPLRLRSFTNLPGQFSPPNGFLSLGRTVLFQATDPGSGTELWITDGTAEGTRLLADLVPGTDSGFPRILARIGNRALIGSRDADGGVRLWRTDGSGTGLEPVLHLRAGRPGTFSFVSPLFDLDAPGPAYFWVGTAPSGDSTQNPPEKESSELWVSDGTPDGTRSLGVFESYPGFGLMPVARGGDVALFRVPKERDTYEIWRSDGTREGTFVVRDAFPERDTGSLSGRPVEQNGRLLFFARDEVSPERLWSTDGTDAGTRLVHAWGANEESSWNTPFPVSVADTVYFVRVTSEGSTLWKSDGTPAGTVPVATRQELIDELSPAGSRLYFREGENALGTTDGTPAGTRVVRRFTRLRSGPSYGKGLTACAGQVFFVAATAEAGSELWVSDGTETGTRQVRDFTPGSGDSELFGLTAVGNRVFFARMEGPYDWSLWVTDGTDAGSVRLRTFGPESASRWNWVSNQGRLYFTASDPQASDEPWTSDGTPAGTYRLKDVFSGASGSYVSRLTPAGRWTYFWSYSGQGQDLWKTDGTEAGTQRVKSDTPWVSPYDEVTAVVGDELYFLGPSNLWRSDGTEAGTGPIPNPPGVELSFPFPGEWGVQQVLLPAGGSVYFLADDGVTGFELWRYGEVDGDRNGLPDAWETAHFGGPAQPDDDSDDDGLSNLDEARAGTDPTQAASTLKVGIQRDDESGLVRLEWPSVPGRHYVVLRSGGVGQVEEAVERRIPATPPVNRFRAGANGPPGPVVYRVRLDD